MNGPVSAAPASGQPLPLDRLARQYGPAAAADWLLVHRHFELGEGFAYIPVFVPEPAAADLARADLQEFLRLSGKELRVIPFPTPADLHELSSRLGEVNLSPEIGALWVAAVPDGDSPDLALWQTAWKHAVARMNERRDVFRSRFHLPLLMVGPPWLQETLLRYAPDLWSVRTLVISLVPDIRYGVTGPQPFQPIQPDFRVEGIPGRADGLDPVFYSLKVVEPLRGLGPSFELTNALVQLAHAYSSRGLSEQALRVANEAIHVAQLLAETGKVGRLVHGEVLAFKASQLSATDQRQEVDATIQLALQELHPLLVDSDERICRRSADAVALVAFRLTHENRLKEAEQEFNKALATQERISGTDHPNTLRSRIGLAGTILRQLRFGEAESEFRVALSLHERLFGAEHPDGLRIRNHLAIALNGQGRYSEAEQIQRAELALREKTFGSEHSDTLACRSNLAATLAFQGRHKEAERELRIVIAAEVRSLGPEHERTLESRQALAGELASQERYAEAEQEYLTAVAGLERALGSDHIATLMSHYHLSKTLEKMGKISEAKTEAGRAYLTGARVLGAEHPFVKSYKQQCEKFGEFNEVGAASAVAPVSLERS